MASKNRKLEHELRTVRTVRIEKANLELAHELKAMRTGIARSSQVDVVQYCCKKIHSMDYKRTHSIIILLAHELKAMRADYKRTHSSIITHTTWLPSGWVLPSVTI